MYNQTHFHVDHSKSVHHSNRVLDEGGRDRKERGKDEDGKRENPLDPMGRWDRWDRWGRVYLKV